MVKHMKESENRFRTFDPKMRFLKVRPRERPRRDWGAFKL